MLFKVDDKKIFKLVDDDGNELVTYTINNKSVINKINVVIEDLNELGKTNPEFFNFFTKLYDKIQYYNKDVLEELIDYANELSGIRVSDIGQYCDITKKKSNSIYLDEADMCDLFVLLSTFKILMPILHSDESKGIKDQIQQLLNDLAQRYEIVNKKIFQIIRVKTLRGDFNDKQFMQFLKYELSYDYLVLYNYSFITTVMLGLYNWETNPVSYIVSIAGDNFNFLVLSYATPAIEYTTEDLPTSTDFIETIAYEMVLNNIAEKLSSEDIKINMFLYSTPLTQVVVLPLMAQVIDIDLSYLRNKQNVDKLMLQVLLYKLLKKTSFYKQYPNIYENLYNIFMYAFVSPTMPSRALLPAFIDVLKHDFTFFGLENKIIILETLKQFATFQYKSSLLRHLTENKPNFAIKGNVDLFKDIVTFIVYLLSDETRETIKSELKQAFTTYIKDLKVNSLMLKMF